MSCPLTYWITAGALAGGGDSPDPALPDQIRHRQGGVRAVTGPDGTELRWFTSSPCFASLYFAIDWLCDLQRPFMLRYFLSGWFEEKYDTLHAARNRLRHIIAFSDVHLLRRAFVREFDPARRPLPALLNDALNGVEGADDFAVDCTLDETIGHFRVARIGAKSAIARLWGHTPVSYPCLPGGSYDRIVSDAYLSVLRTGAPRYDHVYAAMMTPDHSVVWIPYQRVITRRRAGTAQGTVKIVSEVTTVVNGVPPHAKQSLVSSERGTAQKPHKLMLQLDSLTKW
jgi:hypothetical protein